jgi:hypothetical protein
VRPSPCCELRSVSTTSGTRCNACWLKGASFGLWRPPAAGAGARPPPAEGGQNQGTRAAPAMPGHSQQRWKMARCPAISGTDRSLPAKVGDFSLLGIAILKRLWNKHKRHSSIPSRGYSWMRNTLLHAIVVIVAVALAVSAQEGLSAGRGVLAKRTQQWDRADPRW